MEIGQDTLKKKSHLSERIEINKEGKERGKKNREMKKIKIGKKVQNSTKNLTFFLKS